MRRAQDCRVLSGRFLGVLVQFLNAVHALHFVFTGMMKDLLAASAKKPPTPRKLELDDYFANPGLSVSSPKVSGGLGLEDMEDDVPQDVRSLPEQTGGVLVKVTKLSGATHICGGLIGKSGLMCGKLRCRTVAHKKRKAQFEPGFFMENVRGDFFVSPCVPLALGEGKELVESLVDQSLLKDNVMGIFAMLNAQPTFKDEAMAFEEGMCKSDAHEEKLANEIAGMSGLLPWKRMRTLNVGSVDNVADEAVRAFMQEVLLWTAHAEAVQLEMSSVSLGLKAQLGETPSQYTELWPLVSTTVQRVVEHDQTLESLPLDELRGLIMVVN